MHPIPRAIALVACLSAIALTASAQSHPYPDRPITVVVPFSAGGDADLAARNLAVVA